MDTFIQSWLIKLIESDSIDIFSWALNKHIRRISE